MSYDVSIGKWEGNFTHNSLGPLCYNHLDSEYGLKMLDGLTGYEAMPYISAFWKNLNDERHSLWKSDIVGEPEFSAKYDSPNGWGSLIGAMNFMGELTAACGMYPKSMVKVSA